MIRLENVTRYFGSKRAVNAISFHIRKGEVVGFIGPNGAGKTTTMRMITGYLPPSTGEIWIENNSIITATEKAQAHLGYLAENAPVWAGMTVKGFLTYTAQIRGMSKVEIERAIPKIAETCQIQNVLLQGVETLSKGYRHRACFAQALIHNPDILVLDEPTDGLDPEQKNEVRHLIRRLAEEGKTIILSTHILDEVESVCSRIIMINRGECVYDGAVANFKDCGIPGADMSQAFLHYTQMKNGGVSC